MRLNVCNDLAKAMKALDGKKEIVGFRAGGWLPFMIEYCFLLAPLAPPKFSAQKEHEPNRVLA